LPSLIVLVTAAIGLGWEEGKKPIARNQMTDQELIIDALEQAQRILAEYIEPGRGSRRPDFTVSQLLLVLDRKDLALAQERLKARCGLNLVE
jgi:hypothetical protein